MSTPSSQNNSSNSNSNNNTLHNSNHNNHHHHHLNNNNNSSRASNSSGAAHHVQPNQACAACKYQRRKCNPDCSLAPYFPADAQRQFLNAHRLFGLKNIQKIIRDLDPVRQSEAMRSIIFESNVRANDPIGGCHRMVLELERQLERDRAELALVLHQLALCRAQAQLFHPHDHTHHPIHHHHQHQQHQQQQQLFNYFYYDADDQNNNSNLEPGDYHDQTGEVQMEMPAMLSLQQEGCEDHVKPLVNVLDVPPEDKQQSTSCPFDSSNKMEMKDESDAMEHVQEHDLKGAASLFTLTNFHTSSSV